jgi:hypothetical protein
MHRGFWGTVLVALLAATSARAQSAPPPAAGGASEPDAPMQPASPAPAPPPAPAPTASPPPQPNYAPPPPPPQYYWPPVPQYAPPPDETAATAATAAIKRGPYFGAWVGAGAPFGGDTTLGRGFGYKEGVGVIGTAGYAFIPNFGIDAFIHYNRSAISFPSGDLDRISENTGYVVLYGLEARGIVGAGPVVGWGSLGISLGTGSLTLTESVGSGFGSPSVQNDGEATFKVMPVLAFGAEFEVTKGLAMGPQARWYFVSVDSACNSMSGPVVAPTDPNSPPITGPVTTRRCAERLSDATVPDILFLGFGLTYRIGI